MLLALDIGNSQTSIGLFQDSKLLHHFRVETKRSRTEDEFASYLFPLLNYSGLKASDISAVAVCSVVPPAEEALRRFANSYLKLDTFSIHCDLKLGYGLNVETPREVGADRLANAAYAIERMKLPAIVIDLGTATTFDVILPDSPPSYEGGVILPGLSMSFESLAVKTAKLPLVDTEFPVSVIGKTTATCIQSGILYGYLDLLDGLLERTQKEIGSDTSIALTGGLAYLLHKKLKHKSELLPNLTLDGVEILYRKNVS